MKPVLSKMAMLVAILLLAAPGVAGALAVPTTPTLPLATGTSAAPLPTSTSAAAAPSPTEAAGETLASPVPTTPTPAVEAPAVATALPGSLREYVIGYEGELPTGLITLFGGNVKRVDTKLGFAVVELPTTDVLQALLGMDPSLAYVQSNGALFQEASRWDAAQWDAAQWDGAQWDAAQWDAAQWDAARWDAAQWDAAQWDAAQWDAAQWDAARWDGAHWDGSAMDPGFEIQWNLGAIHATDAWGYTSGYHLRTICVADSGIDATHVDLAGNIKRFPDGSFGYDFVNSDNDPSDDGGHGTHVAGIAAATTGNGQGIAGVSQAWLIAAKVLNATGEGTEANLASAIRWCADSGANVILLALHAETDNRAVKDAVKYAADRGVLIVAASGNEGRVCKECVAFPAAYEKVLAVGASTPDSSVATFSNGGEKLHLVAPGVSIAGPSPGGRYAVGSGTSQATAVAAGAAALLWGAKTTLKADDVRRLLEESAKDDGTSGFDYTYGDGHLRLDRAFQKMFN